MSQPASRLHFLDSRSGGHDRSLLSEPISSLEQISRLLQILQIEYSKSEQDLVGQKMERTLVVQMIITI